MLNKKAIAAFAAGATLLSGMALAAPAFVSAPAFAETQNISDTIPDLQNKFNEAQGNLRKAKAAAADAKKTEGEKATARDTVYTGDATTALNADGTLKDKTNYKFAADGVTVEKQAAGTEAVATAATTYLKSTEFTGWKKAAADKTKAEGDEATAQQAFTAAQTALNDAQNKLSDFKAALDAAKTDVENAKKPLDEAFNKLVAAHKATTAATKAAEKAARALTDYKNSVPEDKQNGHDYKSQVKKLSTAKDEAETAQTEADAAEKKAQAAFDKAVTDYKAAAGKYDSAYKNAKGSGVDVKAYDKPSKVDYDEDNYDLVYAVSHGTSTNDNGKGSEGEGGSGEHDKDKNKGKITPEEAKALAEFAVKYVKDAKSDPKTVKALAAALAKVTAAKKAKDAKALVAALKELAKLVEPLMKKAPAKDTGKALESIFGSDVLYTKYKGLAVELIKRDITNIGAYDGLLNQLEFGLSRYGWDNVVKNFPEHAPTNNCDFLAWLRRHLAKAVKHYAHVEAAVKDMKAELEEDMKDELAKHSPEGYANAAVIQQKLNLVGTETWPKTLLEYAHHNRTRAAALLDSANDHAKDLSCDTAAKEVRAAMDKEPNSPFKKSGQKNNAQKPNGQNGQKPNGGAASHQLGKTGATVALVAVAASVLAGMGAALRKIRH